MLFITAFLIISISGQVSHIISRNSATSTNRIRKKFQGDRCMNVSKTGVQAWSVARNAGSNAVWTTWAGSVYYWAKRTLQREARWYSSYARYVRYLSILEIPDSRTAEGGDTWSWFKSIRGLQEDTRITEGAGDCERESRSVVARKCTI